jgi:hypothetical protein
MGMVWIACEGTFYTEPVAPASPGLMSRLILLKKPVHPALFLG